MPLTPQAPPAPAAGAATTTPVATPADGPLRWGLLLVMLAGTFITSLDVFIVNVAIPSTVRDLHAGTAAVEWIVAGYSLAVAAGVITAGRLGDLYGPRRMYAAGLAVFSLASAACGLAPTPGALVAGRVVQGVGAALMTPQALTIIRTVFAGRALARAVSAYGLTMGVAAVFGQLIGGLLIQADVFGLGWRSCFLVNLPVGAVTLILLPRFVPPMRPTPSHDEREDVRQPVGGRGRLDLTGLVLVTLALVATLLPLIEGRSLGWPVWTWASFGAAAVLFAGFAGYQRRLARRGGEPLIDPGLFRERALPTGLAAQLVFWLGQGSFFLVFALYLQQGRGLDPLRSGLVFTAIGAGYLATSTTAHRIAARLGRQAGPAGTVVMALGLALFWAALGHIGRDGSLAWLVAPLVVDGLGMGLALPSLVATVVGSVRPRYAGAASGVLSTVMQVGGALGVALIGVVFYRALGTSGGTVPASGDGYRHALRVSLWFLVAVAVATTALVQLLPRPAGSAR